MSTVATSVVSAAVIGGDLVLGLSDGSIINCGRVQGPQGLKGDQGPMGATGRAGIDGNTIHTVAGAPDTTLGRDGDYAINTTVWEIYGPRAGGAWGTGTPLRGNRWRIHRRTFQSLEVILTPEVPVLESPEWLVAMPSKSPSSAGP